MFVLFFNVTANTEIYSDRHTLSLHDALPIFIDRQDAGIAVMLRRTGLLDEAHAAMDLHAHGSDLAADIGGPGPGGRRGRDLEGPDRQRDRKSTRLNSSH